MQFGGTLHHIIRRVLLADPKVGSVYLVKVDLSNAYIRICVLIEDTPSDGVQPKISLFLSFSSMYQKQFLFCINLACT